VRVLRSTLLEQHGFSHAFATRDDGVSAPPFDSLNLGFHLGDDDDAVRENRARFAESLGVSIGRFFEQQQVHGCRVREIAPTDLPAAIVDAKGDALITRVAGMAVAARTADCVPILLAHPPSGNVAAVHAGWRGAVAGVLPNAIEVMAREPRELVAAIGPHIRVGAFEIGEEVARELERAAGGRPVVERSGDRPHGDLAALVTLQLRDAGLPGAAIDDVDRCTHADAAHFFSHRRDRGRTGRHLSAIVARASL